MSKEDKNIVIVAAYMATEPAKKNFDQLTQLVKDKTIKSDGMILVEKDKDGQLCVSETGDHLGRKGMEWGGGVGLLVGLFAPPLLAATVVGAAVGALVGKFAKNKVVDGLEGGLGQNLKPGQAAVLAIVREEDRLVAEQALADSPAKSVAVMEEGGATGLKAALNEARGKFNPDRTVLPIPDKTFGGAIARTHGPGGGGLELYPWPEGARKRAQCAPRPRRRRRVWRPGHFRRRDPHADAGADWADGPDLQRLPRDGCVLADPGGYAHRAQPSPRRHGRHRGVSGTIPRLHRHTAAQLHRAAAHLEGEWLRDRWLRQVAHDARP